MDLIDEVPIAGARSNSTDKKLILPVKDRPVYISCPHCEEFILTCVVRRPGIRSLLSCCLLSLVAWCGCCFLPCCSNKCTDAVHKCPKCRKVLAVWERKI